MSLEIGFIIKLDILIDIFHIIHSLRKNKKKNSFRESKENMNMSWYSYFNQIL